MSRAAALLAVASLSGSFARTRAASPPDRVPFELSQDSVSHGVPLKVGDLSLLSELEADSLARSASADPSQAERCLQVGPEWLRRSEDGLSLELKPHWLPSRDRILTAYCTDGRVFAAGYEGPRRRAWIFSATEGQSGWAKFYPARSFPVGPFGRQTRYTLSEVRAIDPVSRRILFAGTSETGEPALLAAPFYVVPAASARK